MAGRVREWLHEIDAIEPDGVEDLIERMRAGDTTPADIASIGLAMILVDQTRTDD